MKIDINLVNLTPFRAHWVTWQSWWIVTLVRFQRYSQRKKKHRLDIIKLLHGIYLVTFFYFWIQMTKIIIISVMKSNQIALIYPQCKKQLIHRKWLTEFFQSNFKIAILLLEEKKIFIWHYKTLIIEYFSPLFILQNAAKNILWIFTNTKGTGYRPGDTLVPLLDLIEENKHFGLTATSENWFCFDNESFRSSFSVLNFGTWTIKQVTYLKLRRKWMLLQAEQMDKMTSISLIMGEVVILTENSCHFVSCSACNKNCFLLSLQ